jgi:putative transposase
VTVERLMKVNGWHGMRRVAKVRTTIADPAADRAPDLVKRQFRAPAPGRLVVADFTYVRMASGCFAYTAFAIDAFENRIVGWDCAISKHTSFVETASGKPPPCVCERVEPQSWERFISPIAGSQYTSVRFGETLFLEGFNPRPGPSGYRARAT